MNKDYIKRITSGSYYGDVSSIFSVSGDVKYPMEIRGCFGAFTKAFNAPKKCDVTVRMFPYDDSVKQLTAITPFDTEEIIEYLENLKRIFPFEFQIDEGRDAQRDPDYYMVFSGDKRKCYNITYSMEGPHIAYMFLLTMQRFLYAKDECLYLALAFELKRRYKEFEKMNLFNVLTCVISTVSGRERGGDMFYFNPRYFSYLWSSERLREHLLAKEEKSRKEHEYGADGVADLYSCNIYCGDKRLKCCPNNNIPSLFLDDREKQLASALDVVAANLRVLREYNGYTGELAKKRDAAITENERYVDNNFYNDAPGVSGNIDRLGRAVTGYTFDQSRISAK